MAASSVDRLMSSDAGASRELQNWKHHLSQVANVYHDETLCHIMRQHAQLLAVIQTCPEAIGRSAPDALPNITEGEQPTAIVAEESPDAPKESAAENTEFEQRSAAVGEACAVVQGGTHMKLSGSSSALMALNGIANKIVSLCPHSLSESDRLPTTRRPSFLVRPSFLDSQVARVGKGGPIDTAVGVVILLNVMLMFVYAEWEGWLISLELEIERDPNGWSNAETWFFILEHCFTAFFVAELLAHLCATKMRYLDDTFHCLDACVVVANALDLYILQPLTSVNLGNLTFLRLLRMLKFFRSFRVIRTFQIFKGLRILVNAIMASMMSLVWSMVLILIFVIMGGLLVNQFLGEFMHNADNDYEVRLWCWTYYGTSLRAMYTMFEVTLAGCWPNYVRPLIADVSHLYGLFFVIYVSFVVFAVIRIITAIFLKETLDAANQDAEMTIAEKASKRTAYLKQLKKVFEHGDINGDKVITIEEFERVMEETEVKYYLSHLDLEVHENQLLFNLLDPSGDGQISYEEFIKGVSRLKGQARTLDIVALQLNLEKVLSIISGNGPKKQQGGDLQQLDNMSIVASGYVPTNSLADPASSSPGAIGFTPFPASSTPGAGDVLLL